ncbi:hypothetical protein [Enterococcus sp.]|uniref:hypothetical protein n=1 Tax=Enterococcus sp. TaxID=35783 RepID=UPI00289894B9|nr:hypothetical protein [Enterococcus sp.]
MLGNLRLIPQNYRLAYSAYLCALIGNVIYIIWQQPSLSYALSTVILLFAIDCFLFSKSTEKVLWPFLGDCLIYLLILLFIFT